MHLDSRTSLRSLARASLLGLALFGGCAGPEAAQPAAATPPAAGPPAAAAPAAGAAHASWEDTETALKSALDGAHRTPVQKARDSQRHPLETLKFFGLRKDMNVVELYPGMDGWYTAVLAPVLAEKGKLVVTNYDVNDKLPQRAKYAKAFDGKLKAHADVYAKAQVHVLHPPEVDFGGAGSADLVLTFRSMHGWVNNKTADKNLAAAFKVLKPGGVLGVVAHRGKPDGDQVKAAKGGYITEDVVIKLAEAAGFKLDAKSEVNANPKDTKDHPEGVWALPPTFKLGDKDRAKYSAIGESDRMTLRFVKPKG